MEYLDIEVKTAFSVNILESDFIIFRPSITRPIQDRYTFNRRRAARSDFESNAPGGFELTNGDKRALCIGHTGRSGRHFRARFNRLGGN